MNLNEAVLIDTSLDVLIVAIRLSFFAYSLKAASSCCAYYRDTCDGGLAGLPPPSLPHAVFYKR